MEKHTDLNEIEIIVVDNGSTDGTREYLSSIPYIRTKFNEKNLGFAKGCNQGYAMSSGNAILFLNNDTIVTKNWLTNMLSLLVSSEQIGMVGPLTNYASGPQQIPREYDCLEDIDRFAENIMLQNKGKFAQVLRLVGFCLLAKRAMLENIGLFDESYNIGSFEDDDLCVRAIEKGYHLYIAQDTYVHHEGHATFLGNPDLNITGAFHENKRRFLQKWGIDPITLYYRAEIVENVPVSASRILDIGCAAGAAGIEIKNRQHCKVYGIEKHPLLAKIAGRAYESVHTGDVETYEPNYPFSFFDTMILANILEHLQNPWKVVEYFSRYLQPGATIICTVPNIGHAEVLLPLLQGSWDYMDMGILDKSHLRFFSEKTARGLFPDHLYTINTISKLNVGVANDFKLFLVETIHLAKKFGLHFDHLDKNIETYQFLIKATKN